MKKSVIRGLKEFPVLVFAAVLCGTSSTAFAVPMDVVDNGVYFGTPESADMGDDSVSADASEPADDSVPADASETTGDSISSDASETADPELIMPVESHPGNAEEYGRIICERIGMDIPVYWGDDDVILDWGAGTSTFAFLPGEGKPVILPGHTLTHFSCLQYCEEGDIITFDTDYGIYEYEVKTIQVYDENELLDYFNHILGFEEENTEAESEQEVEDAEAVDAEAEDAEAEDAEAEDAEAEDAETEDAEAEDVEAVDAEAVDAEAVDAETTDTETRDAEITDTETLAVTDAEEENFDILVLYTCYPFYPISERKTNRYTVIAERISGKDVRWEDPTLIVTTEDAE